MTTVRPTPARAIRFALAFFLVNALLVGPSWLLAGGVGPRWIALEAVFVTGLFALLPRRRWTSVAAAGVAATVVFVGMLAFGDATVRLSLARPLNLALDLPLLASVQRLLSGAVGPALAVPALAGLALLPVGVAFALVRLLAALPPSRGATPKAAVAAVVASLGLGLAGARWTVPGDAVSAPGVGIVAGQARSFVEVVRERERFTAESASLPDGYRELPGLLSALSDTDVLLAFIESYGISAVQDEPYASKVRPVLQGLTDRAAAAGLHVATGTLRSPVQGGQSWLAHGSVLGGRWLENHLRYQLLLASGRETLVDDFAHAGHRTAVVMPAITMPWPEAERLGFDEVLVHRDMGYAGPPLNWVTMPDQYTWSFLEREVRRRSQRPLFATVGLISSHAPWTPILPVLEDWDAIGDGSVFAPWEDAGERPAELWRDVDRVREHYGRSVAYAVAAMVAYAERYVDERTLLIALGDHQPAPLITGDGASRAVPVHVITGNPALLRPFLDWGFTTGGLPDPDRTAPRMDDFRHWFVHAFSGRGAEAGPAR